METYNLAHVRGHGAGRAHIALIRNPRNASAVLQRVKKGDVPLQCAIIDARMLTSMDHLLVAVHQAMLRQASHTANLKTKSVHSEVMWNLSMTSNIMESFRVFGLSDQTCDVVVVHIEAEPTDQAQSSHQSILAQIKELIDGDYDEFGPSAAINAWRQMDKPGHGAGLTDWEAVKDAYRLTDEAMGMDDEAVFQSTLDDDALRLWRLKRIDAIVTSTVAVKFVAS